MCVLSQIKPQRRRPTKIGGVLKKAGEEGRGACALSIELRGRRQPACCDRTVCWQLSPAPILAQPSLIFLALFGVSSFTSGRVAALPAAAADDAPIGKRQKL